MFARSHVERAVQGGRHHTALPALTTTSCSTITIARPRASTSSRTASSNSCTRSQTSTTRSGRSVCRTIPQATAAAEDQETAMPSDDMEFSQAASGILDYALNFALVSETYNAHSWMIVLGLLKQEDCRAATVLKDLGLDDLYGAWNEVLWALNVSNGLESRAYTPDVCFDPTAASIISGSHNFAFWAGRSKVQSEDILMALAAGHVLSGLFPDLGLTFDTVRQAVLKRGGKYKLPDDNAEEVAALQEENFL